MDELQQTLEIIPKAKEEREIVDDFLRKSKKVIHYDWCGIYVLDNETNQYKLRAKSDEDEEIEKSIDVLIEDGIIDWILKGNKPKFIPCVFRNLYFFIIPMVVIRRPVGFAAFQIQRKEAQNKNINSLSLQATLLGLVLKGVVYQEEMEDKVNKLKSLMEIAQEITFSINLERLLRSIIETSNKGVKTQYSSISILNPKNKKLIWSKSKGFEIGKAAPTEICRWVINHGKPIHISNFKEDIRFKNSVGHHDIRNVLSFPLKTENNIFGVLTLYNRLGSSDFTNDDFIFLFALSNQAALAIKVASLYDELKKAYKETVLALAEAIEAKDPYTRGHTERVTKYALALAKEMGFKPSEIETLEFASLLHDVGKIGIDERILRKPGELTDQEFREMMRHPIIGQQIVEKVSFLKEVGILIRQHHERFDGKGYPDGLKGKELKKLSCILSIADAFDAMTRERPYRKRLSVEEALEEIKRNAGKQFDPEIAEVALRVFGKLGKDLD